MFVDYMIQETYFFEGLDGLNDACAQNTWVIPGSNLSKSNEIDD